MEPKTTQKFFNHCSTGRADEVAEMVRLGADPEARDTYQLTGLIWAGRKGRVLVAEALLGFGANIDAEDLRKRTALSHAVAYKRREFVKFIIGRGAAINPVDIHGWTPLDIAMSNRDEKTATFLRAHGGVSGRSSSRTLPPMPGAISIGCQTGGPERCLIGDLKVPLCQLLDECVTCTHCPAIDEYGLVLRVDGSLYKYGDEGLARLRFAKARRYITVDIQVPEAVWTPMNEIETRRYLVGQVQAAIAACVNRLMKDRCTVDRFALEAELDAAFGKYLSLQSESPLL